MPSQPARTNPPLGVVSVDAARSRRASGSARRFGARIRAAQWLGVVICALASVGCSSLWKRGPVTDDVLSCRELAREGTGAMQQGDWDKAEGLFASAVETSPVDVQARLHYAQALWHRGIADQAIEHMKEAERLSGRDPKVIVRLGEYYLARGDIEQARKRAERATGAKPAQPAAWALLGDVQQRQGKPLDALASYHRALAYQESFPRVQMEIARIYWEQGRSQRTLATLQSLAENYATDEEPVQVLHLKGMALKQLGRYDDAVESLSAASRRGPPSPDLLFQLAEAELLAGRPASARLATRQALSLAPQHQPSRLLLARIERVQREMTTVNP